MKEQFIEWIERLHDDLQFMEWLDMDTVAEGGETSATPSEGGAPEGEAPSESVETPLEMAEPGAKKQIMKERKQEFMKERLPELFRQMQLLGITLEDVKNEYAATFGNETTSNEQKD